MFEKIDEKTKLEIFITSVATLTSLFFIGLSYLLSDYAVQILSLLVIVLPTIYIIGNLVAKSLLQSGFDVWMEEMQDGLEELKNENSSLRMILMENGISFDD